MAFCANGEPVAAYMAGYQEAHAEIGRQIDGFKQQFNAYLGVQPPAAPGAARAKVTGATKRKPTPGASNGAPPPKKAKPPKKEKQPIKVKPAVKEEKPPQKQKPPAPKKLPELGPSRALDVLEEVINCDERRRAQSQKKVEQLLAKFAASGREHIDTKPVYLGFVRELKNKREYPMTSASVSREIDNLFENQMTKSTFDGHLLREYFEPSKDGNGYVPKKVRSKSGALEKMYDVDHVVPSRWGGIDHPRNFVVMHRSMNRALGDAMPEDKMAYLDASICASIGTSIGNSALRKVADFIRDLRRSSTVQSAHKAYIEQGMPAW